MFVDLAQKARHQTNREWLQLHSTLAPKCAAGSRQAIIALAELRALRSVLFAKRANVNNGGQQQVTNRVVAPTQSRGKEQATQPASWGGKVSPNTLAGTALPNLSPDGG